MKLSPFDLPTDYILAFSPERVGPLGIRRCQHPLFTSSSRLRVLGHQGKGLAELEARGRSTSISHSFQKADITNERVVDKVSAFARSLVPSQHLTLPLMSPSFSELHL